METHQYLLLTIQTRPRRLGDLVLQWHRVGTEEGRPPAVSCTSLRSERGLPRSITTLGIPADSNYKTVNQCGQYFGGHKKQVRDNVCLCSSWVTPSFSAVRATSLFCSSLPRPWLHPLGQGCSQSPHAPSLGGVLRKFPKPSAASPLSLLPPQPVLLSLSTVPEPQPVPKPLPRGSSLPYPSPADTAPFPKPSAPCPQQPAPPRAPLCRGHPAVTAALGRDPRLSPGAGSLMCLQPSPHTCLRAPLCAQTVPCACTPGTAPTSPQL